MRKSKIKYLITLSLLLFYLFSVMISFFYTPPHKNYSDEDISQLQGFKAPKIKVIQKPKVKQSLKALVKEDLKSIRKMLDKEDLIVQPAIENRNSSIKQKENSEQVNDEKVYQSIENQINNPNKIEESFEEEQEVKPLKEQQFNNQTAFSSNDQSDLYSEEQQQNIITDIVEEEVYFRESQNEEAAVTEPFDVNIEETVQSDEGKIQAEEEEQSGYAFQDYVAIFKSYIREARDIIRQSREKIERRRKINRNIQNSESQRPIDPRENDLNEPEQLRLEKPVSSDEKQESNDELQKQIDILNLNKNTNQQQEGEQNGNQPQRIEVENGIDGDQQERGSNNGNKYQGEKVDGDQQQGEKGDGDQQQDVNQQYDNDENLEKREENGDQQDGTIQSESQSEGGMTDIQEGDQQNPPQDMKLNEQSI